MAGFKSKHDVWMFWQANSDIFSEVFPDLFGEMPSTSTITRAQRLIESDVLGDAIKEIMEGSTLACVYAEKYTPQKSCQCAMFSHATDRQCARQHDFSLTADVLAASRLHQLSAMKPG